jgi:alpha-1,3-rhamnosyl/mannosyltransferase
LNGNLVHVPLEKGKLRIGVDLAPLRPPLTGVGNYELYLLAALLSRSDAPQVHGFARRTWREVDAHYIDEIQLERPDGTWPGYSRPLRLIKRSGIAREVFAWVRRRAFERSCDAKNLSLFHAFAYMAPGKLSAPTIPVVYDLSFVRFPETHPPARLQRLRRLAEQLQAAPVVHTISHFSAREIADIFGISLTRIAVIYPGVLPSLARISSENPSEALAQYKLEPGKFLLVVSTLEPRKNLRSLVMAYSRVSRADRNRLPLCVVGAAGWGSLDLPESSQALEREGSLRFLGFVSNQHLRTLYTNTRAMFYPSTYEGFGMPIVDALACGARVICSDAAAMPEAGGNVVRPVAPLDIDGWFREVQLAAENADCDIQERNRRQLHAQQFTWERAAAQTMQLYQRATA